ncbi:peptidase inhibitor family I36 protein [Arthrobacter sp. ERGS1:01]|uniref:peptidase inhibitor family I36 protein n=1 Tax=Arthrobacter sp. ERGS1:01 TaxID=1704044 RepID=UPI000D1CD6E9|nr:peptidase inhibitor family I36 protein [Arthrobacter sp. ERGS1:01]
MKKIISAGVVALVLAGGGVAAAAPANAADLGACKSSTVCVYDGDQYKGANLPLSGYTSYSTLGLLTDKVTSWRNACNAQAFYLGDTIQGARTILQVLSAGWSEPNVGTARNDKADFVAWANS